MYRVTQGIHIHFAHHVRGHVGSCISLHGHTWKFEVTLGAEVLDNQGFVLDFDELAANLLSPCHLLLDHALALGEPTWRESREVLEQLGRTLVGSRRETLGHLGSPQDVLKEPLAGARSELCGGIKIAVFPFSPTSERLAEWLHRGASERLANERVRVLSARIYETLLPTESIAEFVPG
jgi:6-pyruvoyl-tetrahydropterin synthase